MEQQWFTRIDEAPDGFSKEEERLIRDLEA